MQYDEDKRIIEYSQREIVNKKLLQRLVIQSSITAGDLVYDIGCGSGVISEALLNNGAKVIAIEKDQQLYLECKQKFINQDRFELYLDDFLIREFPPKQRYKIFSNIPFFHTADIINRILFNNNPPDDCYLIIQKEAAEKHAGIPKETLVSLLIKPVFWINIIYNFRRNDFYPDPSVDIAMLQVEKRRCQLVSTQHYGLYKDFVVFCREKAHKTIKKPLKHLFSHSQIKQLARVLNIDYRADPADLNFMQYLGLFQFYLDYNLKNIASIQGSEKGLRKQQAGRIAVCGRGIGLIIRGSLLY